MGVIRGTSIVAVASSSVIAVPFPAGSVTGDQAYLFGGHADAVTAPAGWTNIQNTFGGANWAGQTCTKTLSAGDVGSAVMTAGGTADGIGAMLVIRGANAGVVREFHPARFGVGSNAISVTTSAAVQSADLAVYFGSNRGNSADTVDHGTQYGQVTTGNIGSGCLYAAYPSPAGATTIQFLYPTAGSGNYEMILIVEISRTPVSPGIILEPQIDCPTGVNNEFVRFRLRNFAGSVPQTTGSGNLAEVTGTLDAGSIDQNLIPNTSITPAGTFYTTEIWSNGRITASGNATLTGDADLSTLL